MLADINVNPKVTNEGVNEAQGGDGNVVMEARFGLWMMVTQVNKRLKPISNHAKDLDRKTKGNLNMGGNYSKVKSGMD